MRTSIHNLTKQATRFILVPGLVLVFSIALSHCFISNSISAVSDSLGSVSDSLGSISTSLGSISDSFASSSESSSPSGDSAEEEAYRTDVRNFTHAFVASGGTPADFQRELSHIARANGILNWAARPATYVAIGAGLQSAGVDRAAMQSLIASLNDYALDAGTRRRTADYLWQGYYSYAR